MPVNFGAFAGGMADGYRKQNADNRAQAQEKIIKDQADRQAADQKKRDEVLASVAKADQERRSMAPSPDLAPLPSAAAGIINNPAGAPQEAGAEGTPATQSALLAATGIRQQPAEKLAAKPVMPSLRPHTAGDKMQMIDDTFNGFLSNGLLDDAAKIAPMRMALINEKLHNETKAREDAVQKFISAINSGNDEAALAAGQSLSSMVPDGKDMTAFKTLPDGNVQVQYGDGAPTVMPMEKLTTGAIAIADWKTALNYVHQNQQAALAAAKSKQESDQFNITNKLQRDALTQKTAHDHAIEAAYGSGKKLTTSQQRTNEMIESARQKIKSMTEDEIKQGTQQYSATGRENANYDPLLASRVRMANARKYGEDADFMNADTPDVSSLADQAPQTEPANMNNRFSADPAMKGYRLGNQTTQGAEVYDSKGNLVGHYN